MDPLIILAIGIIVVVGGVLGLKLHPFLVLVLGAMTVALFTSTAKLEAYADSKGMSQDAKSKFVKSTIGSRVADGFGNTAGKIGILIAMAALIGMCLLESGAADRIIRSALKLFGEKRAPFAFMGSGFTLGIPVYFDTVFYLMIPLAKALATRTGKNFCLYICTIIAGATIAHSLVPPTPGPLLVANELNVNIGKMMIGGILVGLLTLIVGYSYAVWINKKLDIPVRENDPEAMAKMEEIAQKDTKDLPSLFVSLLPIVLPVFLIAGGTIVKNTIGKEAEKSALDVLCLRFFNFFGDKNIALTISAIIALITLAMVMKGDTSRFKASMSKAILSAGGIILITAAGGAFGATLQQTGIGPRIKELATSYHIAILPLAFFVTVLVRTAQGSATVAMITAVGILSGLAADGNLGFDPLYLALAIGCGSKPFPWMNDSGFWVISKMSGMTESETLKTSSSMMSLMGLFGLIVIMIAAKIFPMV